MSEEQKPLEGERAVSSLGIAICFAISAALAVFAITIADDVAVWIRAMFVVAACFFGWLLFFAPVRARVAVVRWFDWWS